MDDSEAMSLEQIQAFLGGSGGLRLAGQRRQEVYGWVEQTLVRYQYGILPREGKGLIRRYVARMTGLSRSQVTLSGSTKGRKAREEGSWRWRPKSNGENWETSATISRNSSS